MSKKNKIILTVSLIILLVVIIAAVIIWKNANSANVSTKSAEEVKEGIMNQESGIMNGKEGKEGGEVRVKEAVVLSAEEIEEENLKAMAMSFAERWGSWSTDGDYSNFNSLKVQMTDEMKKFADAEVVSAETRGLNADLPAQAGSNADLTQIKRFYGITTKALSASVKEKDDSNAVLTVIVQKSINEDGAVNVAYGEVELGMVKEGGRWAVSRINF